MYFRKNGVLKYFCPLSLHHSQIVPLVPQVAHGRNMQATMEMSTKDGLKRLA